MGIVKKFLEASASVVVVDFDAELLKTLRETHPSIETHQVNLADWKGTTEVVQSIGCIHHLVNNAGIGRPAEKFLDIKPDSVDQYELQFENCHFKLNLQLGHLKLSCRYLFQDFQSQF